MEAFNKLMYQKGYTGPFVVNNSYSGELLEAVKACATAAEAAEHSMFPLILHTRVKSDDPLNMSLLQLRCDEGDAGIKIRDATIDQLNINGIMKRNVVVPFTSTEKFPSNDDIMGSVKKRFTKKIKRKGL